MTAPDPAHEPPTLVGLLDGLVDQGVHVAGDLVIGLADVELIRVAVRLLVASEETAQRTGVRHAAAQQLASPRSPGQRTSSQPTRREGHDTGSPREATPRTPARRAAPTVGSGERQQPEPSSNKLDGTDREQLVRGVSQLVLTLVEVIRDLLERQAIRRVEAGGLDDDQIERLGIALQALEERMAEMKEVFGVTDEDLNLDLGPLGRLR